MSVLKGKQECQELTFENRQPQKHQHQHYSQGHIINISYLFSSTTSSMAFITETYITLAFHAFMRIMHYTNISEQLSIKSM